MLVFLHFEYGKPQVAFAVYCGYGCFCLCSLSELWVPICHFVLAPSSILIMNNILPFAILLYILILPVLFLKASFYSFCISDLKVSIDLSSSSLVSPSDVPKWLTQPLMETFPYFCCCSFCILNIFFVFFLRSVSWLTLASWCLCSHWGLSHGNCNYFKRPT